MRIAVALALTAAITLATSASRADEPRGRAFSVGVRLGYGIPFGKISDDTLKKHPWTAPPYPITPVGSPDLASTVSGMVPLWLDAGVKVTPRVYVGAFFVYGIAFMPRSSDSTAIMSREVPDSYTQRNPFPDACDVNGVSCAAHVIQWGVNVHYHLLPSTAFDPWLGVGVGYETLAGSSDSGESWSFSTSGPMVSGQAGLDIPLGAGASVGPFVALSVGQLRSLSVAGPEQGDSTLVIYPRRTNIERDYQTKTLHEWLVLGVRSTFDFGF